MLGILPWRHWRQKKRCGPECQFQVKLFELGECVLQLMKDKDLDRDGVCERLGVTHEFIDHILHGR